MIVLPQVTRLRRRVMDDCHLWPSEDKGFARSLIRSRARRLIRAGNLPSSEEDELEQELTVDLWRSSRSFDSSRGTWQGFASTVVTHAGSKILRNRFAQKRDDRSTASLSVTEVATDGNATELSQAISEHERGKHRGIVSLPADVHADLRMDLAQVTATLPANLQSVVSMYGSFTTSEIVELSGIKRSTLKDLKRRVRQRFEQSGFEKYFEN